MARSLRAFIETVEREAPEEVVHIDKQVNPANFDVTAILQHLENRGEYPMVVFHHPLDVHGNSSHFPLVTNIYASRRRLALALGMAADEWKLPLSLEYARREARLLPPETLASDEAAVKEVVLRGEEVDVGIFPIVRHNGMDPAPYMDMAPVMRDRDSGAYNSAFIRSMYKGPNKTTLGLAFRHNWQIIRKHDEVGERTRVAIVQSHHPAYYLGVLNVAPFGVDDYGVIGSIMNEPLRLAPSETWGNEFLVPADAEIIIEGEMPPEGTPGCREIEAPFGEFTGYYGPQTLARVLHITAVTHRRDAIYQDVFAGHRDHWVLGTVPKEGSLFNRVRGMVPTVQGIHFPNSGCGRFNCYVSIDRKVEGEAKQAAMIVLGECDFVKNVVLVDGDIDPFSEEQVLWAVATRTQADRDIDILRNCKGNQLDPSQPNRFATAKLIIDACKPVGRPFEEKLQVPQVALQRIRIDDYLEAPPQAVSTTGGR